MYFLHELSQLCSYPFSLRKNIHGKKLKKLDEPKKNYRFFSRYISSSHHRTLENKVCNAQIECMHEKKSTSG